MCLLQEIENSQKRNLLFLQAYLIHLLAPLFLILDVVVAWRFPDVSGPDPVWWVDFGPTSQFVFTLGALWLAFGLGLLFLALKLKLFSLSRLEKPLTAVYGIIGALLLVELFLQVAPVDAGHCLGVRIE